MSLHSSGRGAAPPPVDIPKTSDCLSDARIRSSHPQVPLPSSQPPPPPPPPPPPSSLVQTPLSQAREPQQSSSVEQFEPTGRHEAVHVPPSQESPGLPQHCEVVEHAWPVVKQQLASLDATSVDPVHATEHPVFTAVPQLQAVLVRPSVPAPVTKGSSGTSPRAVQQFGQGLLSAR